MGRVLSKLKAMLVIIQIEHDIEDNNITLYFYQENMEVLGCEKKKYRR